MENEDLQLRNQDVNSLTLLWMGCDLLECSPAITGLGLILLTPQGEKKDFKETKQESLCR